MELHNIRNAPGAKRRKKRIARGLGSGIGKTGGVGTKGAHARSGKANPYRGFEGGQMPLVRRLPKRGFTNHFQLEFNQLNLGKIQDKFEDGEIVEFSTLKVKGLISKKLDGIKILSMGEFSKKLTFKVQKMSAAALEKVEKVGGTVEILIPVVKKTKKFKKALTQKIENSTQRRKHIREKKDFSKQTTKA